MFKNLSGYIGYIVGSVVILPLLLFVINIFFFKGNDASKYLADYMRNYRDITLHIPNYENSNLPNDDLYYHKRFTTKLATKNMGRDGSSKARMEYRLIFDTVAQKYFQIIMFDLGYELPVYGNTLWTEIDNNKINARVNIEDYENYGTKEHPIPVFKVSGFDKPLQTTITSQDPPTYTINLNTSEKQYKYNVYMYLTYIMPKKEFKERFEKGSKQ